MLIRLTALALAFTACLDVPPSLEEHQDDIICTPLCAPGYTGLLEDTYSYAYRLFPDAGYVYYEGCANPYGPWECTVTIQTGPGRENACSRIDCAQPHGTQPPWCSASQTSCP
jgi:hypothetical protein